MNLKKIVENTEVKLKRMLQSNGIKYMFRYKESAMEKVENINHSVFNQISSGWKKVKNLLISLLILFPLPLNQSSVVATSNNKMKP